MELGGKRRYGTPYSSSALTRQVDLATRWQTHPNEHARHPVAEVYRSGSPGRATP